MTTKIFAIVDRSGSMQSLTQSTIDGYNEFVDKLRKEKGVRLTTVLFDHEQLIPVDDKPIKDVAKLDRETYYPRGSTALIDAVCSTLNERKKDVKSTDKALVLIITDGYENASKEYTSDDMRDLIHGLEKKKNWTFTYLGANQDSWDTAKKWGFKAGNVANYNATMAGTGAVYAASSNMAVNLVRGSAMNVGAAFDDKVKAQLEDIE